MTKPQFYTVELSNFQNIDDNILFALFSIYRINSESSKAADIKKDIENKKRVYIDPLPLDIAETLTDIFLNECNRKHAKVEASLVPTNTFEK
jgi:hypothetical protein